ncbi:peptide chain release factor N(5)-glutamine methyltransferase [Desulfovibrio psychrotolerans]|uniref:Release factor glutamine methyltransferase n=1 Tax=Desulfovibrio psychrotolerans TaxID=415242 RepID=A0A7J0BVZ6_9BACT|nr:peptide chain release factor N(5)-glutamine methyltransferase [Desulfovibrio psychrotolerans]GFM37858.1 release factor glutamine methyltransferase [Desulfovibrio psychrotolerans]
MVSRPAPCTIRTVIAAFSDYLSGKAVDSPRLSAGLICMHVLGKDRLHLLTNPHQPVTDSQWAAMLSLVLRRGQGEPAAYLIGSREFFGREFTVSPATLIPRPETEHIVEEVVRQFARSGPFTFADLGTGSGCIAVSIAAELPHARGIAVDRSADALSVAARNARRHGVADRILFVQGDFTSCLFRPGSLDCVATNPPYVSAAEHAQLSSEVRDFEPASALVPGAAGTEHADILIPSAACWLRPGGLFVMEMGCSQGPYALAALNEPPRTWQDARIVRDLAGLDRLAVATRSAYQCEKTTQC